ncbi:hypothetical protein KJS94_15435 [Flavihumibacter rivuli]|uniref:hypothetical protein n=1 Tax=Flavihumibacter rivuli TaxID=2838156 RepID=UPI001BDE3A94|nr:hypothetical protein [Flavihumibacter rivuli]ULQ56040.1 hypothetical protein KJS94_15435 [Flavihumibacter rivuli]
MVITEEQELSKAPLPLRLLAHFFSYLFHPIFIPGYITAYLLYLHPFAFAGEDDRYKLFKLASVVFSTTFFPAFTVLLLKQLGFASSMQLRTQKERIIPIVASMIFYFWAFYVSKNQPDNPPELVQMLCAVFVSSIIALTANNFMKISLHAIAMGILVGFFIMMAWSSVVPMGVFVAISLLIAGITGTSRMLVSDHTNREMGWGFLTGLISMLIGMLVSG